VTQNMTIADCRNAGYCVKGVKTRFESLGLDFRLFAREGLPAAQMEQINDAQIARALDVTRARLEKESRDGKEEA